MFSEYDLLIAMRRSIENAIRDIDEIENELAVDLGVLLQGRPLSAAEMSAARDAFRHTMANAAGSAQWDLAKTVGRMTAAERIGGMTTKIMSRFGGKILKMIKRMIEKKIQKQILKTIAKKAVKKVGVKVVEKTVKVVSALGGPVVCCTVSVGIDVAIEWIDDPAADVAADVRSSLRDIGYKSQRDIITQFDPILTQRRRTWERAAKEMLK